MRISDTAPPPGPRKPIQDEGMTQVVRARMKPRATAVSH